ARRTQCKNNLKQLGLAMHNYHDTYRTFPNGANHGAWAGTGWHTTWILSSLPYLEQDNLHSEFQYGIFTRDGETAARTILPAILCPSDPGVGSGRLVSGGNDGRAGYWWGAELGYTNYKGCNGSMWVGAPYQRSDATGRFGSDTPRDLEFG